MTNSEPDLPPGSVRTERLLLRPFTLDDLPAYVRIRDEASVRDWLRSPDEPAAIIAERSLRHFMDEWRLRGYGPWAVVDRRTGELLGHHGLRYMPDFDGETEVLYTLSERVRRQGIGVEAGRAALAYGFGRLGLGRVMAITLHDNLASRGVMERLGMTYRRDATHRGLPVVYYAIDRAEWQRQAA